MMNSSKQFFISASLLIVITIGLITAYPMTLFAQPTADAVGTGTTWLLNARYGFGTWAFTAPPDPLQMEFTADDYTNKTYIRDTLEGAKALQVLNLPATEYQLTLNWLEFSRFNVVGQLAQKIQILSKVGNDTTTTITALLESRNSDGGFGGAKGYPISNNLDTALALQALKAANYSDTTVLYQAINYLTTNQNSDGGWAFVFGGPSNAYVTSLTLRALAAFSSTFNVQSSIDKAKAYLLTKQNTDGGFGSSPSTIYETALSIISLIESGFTPLESSPLTGQGSATTPQAGEVVTITATVGNTGLDNASNVIVRFYNGNTGAGGKIVT